MPVGPSTLSLLVAESGSSRVRRFSPHSGMVAADPMDVTDKIVRPPQAEPISPGHEVIELRIGDLRQLFNSIDPSPFHERDLDQNAEAFIVGWARDLPRKASLALVVYVDRSVAPQEPAIVRDAVRAFFSHRANCTRQNLRQLLRIGRTSFLIGIMLLAASIGLGSFVAGAFPGRPFAEILRESLLIAGWVAMWRPLEIFLYDWWPIRNEAALFDRLSAMPVHVVSTQSRNSERSVGPTTLR